MKSQVRKNWPKYLLQWGTLAALIFFLSGLAVKLFPKIGAADPETYCPFGGLEAFVTYLVRDSLPCTMSSVQIIMGLALAACVVLFSKLFCGYICPIGSVEDILTKAGRGMKLRQFEITQGCVADKILRLLKYVLLFWVLYMTATSSELFCKKLDPYYAGATLFKGEIVLWMSIVTVCLVIIPALFVKRFWCKYLCPLGAISNSLKFWVWMVVLVCVYWILSLLGVKISWFWLLGAWCLLAWILEVFRGKSGAQLLHVSIDQSKCGRRCYSCQKKCPYNIDVPSCGKAVLNVDCVLCGECIAACPSKALSISAVPGKKGCGFCRFLPAIIAVALLAAAFVAGGKFELPTIDVNWGVDEGMKLETMKVENLKSVKCYSSSMAFKAKMEGVKGVHGVKTFVKSHSVVISYDPQTTSPEKIQEQIFVPSHFRVWTPDPAKISELKCITIRTEKMNDKLDLNYLGLQFRNTGKGIFGLESEYDCPLRVKVYMSPDENLDEAWFKEIVNRKVLAMPVHGGGVKETKLDFEFVRMEKGEERIAVADYLEKMFDHFKAEYKGEYISAQGDTTYRLRAEVYDDEPQYIYEVSNQNYEKPIIKNALPYLSNHLSKEEGVIGTYLNLNADLVPSIQVRFAAPMTSDRLWELMTMEKWTITYKTGDVREENARLKFEKPGIVYEYKK